MKSQDYDVLIIGAGPAGGMSAYLLARRGFRVLLVERCAFPRYKVCGGCISATGLAILKRNGLSERIRAVQGEVLSAAHLQSGDSSLRLKLPGGISISRERFDQTLVEAAQEAGALFFADTTAQLTTAQLTTAQLTGVYDDHRTVTLVSKQEKRTVTASIVIAANGLTNLTGSGYRLQPFTARKRYVGVGAQVPHTILQEGTGTISMTSAGHGYLGAATIEGAKMLLAAALDPLSIKLFGGINAAIAEIARANPIYRDFDFASLHFSATPLLSQRLLSTSQHRLFVVGDAAGFVEPFTGEGIAWALRGAELVADLVANAVPKWDRKYEELWRKSHRQEISRRHTRCHYLTQSLRIPLVTRGVMRVGNTGPLARSAIASLLHGPEVSL